MRLLWWDWKRHGHVGVFPVCWTVGQCRCITHCAVDGAQRHEALHVVGQGAAVGVPVGILSSLQDELLALEIVVLETHPASQTHTKYTKHTKFTYL